MVSASWKAHPHGCSSRQGQSSRGTSIRHGVLTAADFPTSVPWGSGRRPIARHYPITYSDSLKECADRMVRCNKRAYSAACILFKLVSLFSVDCSRRIRCCGII